MTNRFLIFIVSASLMLGSGFSCSETVEHGFEAYKRGDFSNALRIFRAAEQGDSTAQLLRSRSSSRLQRSSQVVPQEKTRN